MATATRTSLRPAPRRRAHTQIHVLDNPLGTQDPALARALEAALHDVLGDEDLGMVEVRFRVCRELNEGLRFICKVENPPEPDVLNSHRLPLRWWSPLMESARDFRSALMEAMEVRRERLLAMEVPSGY
jgi:hypothetical protein